MSVIEREVICLVCPLGCKIKVKTRNNETLEISGYQCPKGIEYSKQEVTNPLRPFMSVIKVRNGAFPTVSVKAESLVPKRLLRELSRRTACLKVEAPVKCKDTVYEDPELKIKLLATRNVPKAGKYG